MFPLLECRRALPKAWNRGLCFQAEEAQVRMYMHSLLCHTHVAGGHWRRRFLTILEEGWRIYMGSKREVGLKEEIGLVHRGPRKLQLLSTPAPRQWFWRKGVIQCNSLPRGREYKVDLVKGSRYCSNLKIFIFLLFLGSTENSPIHVLSGSLNSVQAADIPEKEHLGRKYVMKRDFPCQKKETHLPPSPAQG